MVTTHGPPAGSPATPWRARASWPAPTSRCSSTCCARTAARVVGPTVADGAIVYDEITSLDDLPRGVGDEQAPGRYRLRRRGDERLFGYVVGPTAWKKWTFPALVPLTRATKDGHKVEFTPETTDAAQARLPGRPRLRPRRARRPGPGLHRDGTFVDPDYAGPARASVFIVAVQCTTAASTCFCTSMGTGPEVEERPRPPADRARRRLPRGGRHGRRPRARGPAPAAARRPPPSSTAPRPRWRPSAPASATRCPPPASTIGSSPSSTTRAGRRSRSAASPAATARWPARRASARRSPRSRTWPGRTAVTYRSWDSCFSPGFAKVAGGSFRSRPRDRYRQWLTHKFATWWDQFGQLRLRRLRPLHHLVPGRHRRPRRAQRDRPGGPARPGDADRRAGGRHPQRLRHGPRRRHQARRRRTRRRSPSRAPTPRSPRAAPASSRWSRCPASRRCRSRSAASSPTASS